MNTTEKIRTNKEPFDWEMKKHDTHFSLIPWMQAKEITIMDLMILYVADAMTKEKHGCYSANEYIAQAVGGNHLQVSKRIQHLNKIGLLVICYYKGKRHIEPEWKRSEGDRRDMKGEYAKKHREAYEVMFKNKRELNLNVADRYRKKDENREKSPMRQRIVEGMRQRIVEGMRQRIPNIDNTKSNKDEECFPDVVLENHLSKSKLFNGSIPSNQSNGHTPAKPQGMVDPNKPRYTQAGPQKTAEYNRAKGFLSKKRKESTKSTRLNKHLPLRQRMNEIPSKYYPYIDDCQRFYDSLKKSNCGLLIEDMKNSLQYFYKAWKKGVDYRPVLDFYCKNCSIDREDLPFPTSVEGFFHSKVYSWISRSQKIEAKKVNKQKYLNGFNV